MTPAADTHPDIVSEIRRAGIDPEAIIAWMDMRDWYRLDTERDGDWLMFNTALNGRRDRHERISVPAHSHDPLFNSRLIELVEAVASNACVPFEHTFDQLTAFTRGMVAQRRLMRRA